MKRIVAVALSIMILPCLVSARDKPAFSGPVAEMMANKRNLLISAHPDDESLFAPLMAEVCRFNGATCHMVVTAEAQSPGCIIPLKLRDGDQCRAMRRQETAASAANLNATHEFYGWRDMLVPWNDAGVDRNISEWAKDAGARSRWVQRIAKTLEQFKPDVVLGFDARHGTTCHPNHRAAILLAIDAIKTFPSELQPQVWLESDFAVPTMARSHLASIIDGFGVVRWPGDNAPVMWYDGNSSLPNGRTTWDDLVGTLRHNSTRFPDVASGTVTPSQAKERRLTPFVKLADIDPPQPGMCEPYTPEFSRSS